MNVLVTGANGFIGQRLTKSLLDDGNVKSLITTDVGERPGVDDSRATYVSADLNQSCDAVVKSDLNLVYILHGIMSGGAESDFDLGMRVNVDSVRKLLDTIRSKCPGIRVVYASSVAVYGGSLPEVITDEVSPSPQSSYGTEKRIVELLINDYSRRGFIDGIVIRYPTVIVRPGPPSSATSSFCSAIIREPLEKKSAVLPVRRDLAMWFASINSIIAHTVKAAKVSTKDLKYSRIVNLPGMTVTVQQMLDMLVKVSGDPQILSFIKEEKHEVIESIVTSWPAQFDTSTAARLGFDSDQGLEQAIIDYINTL